MDQSGGWISFEWNVITKRQNRKLHLEHEYNIESFRTKFVKHI